MCGVGAKFVAHLMKFHLLQSEVVKVKFLMNSNMTLRVLNLYQKTDPKVQQDFKGQGHYDKVKSGSHHDVAHLHSLTSWCDLDLTFDLAVVTLSLKILSGLYLRNRKV